MRGGPALAVALALACLACRAEPRVAVERVVVAESTAAQRLAGVGVGLDAVARSAGRLLAGTPGFVTVAKVRPGDRRFLGVVHLQLAEVLAGAGGETSAQVILTLELTPVAGDGALRETARGTAPLGAGPGGLGAAFEKATSSALQRAARAFSTQLAAEGKRNRDLMKDLASSEPRVREQAMRVLAERGDHGAVPALIARLSDPDPAVSERAVGALAQLRDPRAVPPLIQLVHRRDPAYVANMARIIGDIGGPDARAWLLTMASGHPDASVRRAAHDALADITSREPQASASGEDGSARRGGAQ